MRRMRASHRKTTPRRTRVRAAAPAAIDPGAAAALRRGREALAAVEGQLDSILAWLANPAAGLDRGAPDRLAGSAAEAGEALAALGRLRGLVAERL